MIFCSRFDMTQISPHSRARYFFSSFFSACRYSFVFVVVFGARFIMVCSALHHRTRWNRLIGGGCTYTGMPVDICMSMRLLCPHAQTILTLTYIHTHICSFLGWCTQEIQRWIRKHRGCHYILDCRIRRVFSSKQSFILLQFLHFSTILLLWPIFHLLCVAADTVITRNHRIYYSEKRGWISLDLILMPMLWVMDRDLIYLIWKQCVNNADVWQSHPC